MKTDCSCPPGYENGGCVFPPAMCPREREPDPADEIALLTAENARLREALTEVRAWYDNEFTPSYDIEWRTLERILDAALNGEPRDPAG